MPHKPLTLRALTISALAAALTIGALAATTAPASAQAAPSDLKSDIRNSSTAVLSWGAVKKATSYEVQVDASSSFSSLDYSAKTTNTKAVPSKALIPGKNFWRVRSVLSTDLAQLGFEEHATLVGPVRSGLGGRDVRVVIEFGSVEHH